MHPQAPAPRLENLNDEELLRALHLEREFIPDPHAWCDKWRELSARYRAKVAGVADAAEFWDEWRKLMRPFSRLEH